MPENRNPRAVELLGWHGHDKGGVHVPFQVEPNPFGHTIATPLIDRLRALARDLALPNSTAPRRVFLVGGPGNGKSEAVQDFLTTLDVELGAQNHLINVLKTKFTSLPLLSRRVTVDNSDLHAAPGAFASRIGRLIIIQDATAIEEPNADAAKKLAEDLCDLETAPDSVEPVIVVCANRGLLVRAIREADGFLGGTNNVTLTLTEVVRVTSLGAEAFSSATRPSCWPLRDHAKTACWPLDLETLLAVGALSPFEQAFQQAAALSHWEVDGRCNDCSSRELCPFRKNAEWLRDPTLRNSLRRVLRHGELRTGQRWNFRDLFSLIAELIIGQWSDFHDADHPCDWVHEQVGYASVSAGAAVHVLPLVLRLYPNALFPVQPLKELAEYLLDQPLPWLQHPFSLDVLHALSGDSSATVKPIREYLGKNLAPMDPSVRTAFAPTHPLRVVEDDYSQSIEIGAARPRPQPLSPLESLLLHLLDHAEKEWDLLARDSTKGSRVTRLMRRLASVLVNRSVGIRLGHHALEDHLGEYELALRDQAKLMQLKDSILALFGGSKFRFNVVESLGQPQAEGGGAIKLESEAPKVRPHVAPASTGASPGHDLPHLEVRGSDFRMPITFDFFMALRLRDEGCAGSSLPASVRAALDRVRHQYAGHIFHQASEFVDGSARVSLPHGYELTLLDESAEPKLEKRAAVP